MADGPKSHSSILHQPATIPSPRHAVILGCLHGARQAAAAAADADLSEAAAGSAAAGVSVGVVVLAAAAVDNFVDFSLTAAPRF